MALSKINPLNPPRQGTFEKPLSLDLKPYVIEKRFLGEYPKSLKRLLSSVNIGLKPTGEGGVLAMSQGAVDVSVNTSMAILKKLESMGDYETGAGLYDIEKDNFSKIVDASGFRAMAHFMDGDYPWEVKNNPDPKIIGTYSEACRSLGILLKRVGKYNKFPDAEGFTSGKLHKGGYEISYRKGSSYGVFPYIPGSSKLNGVALAYHGLTACAISNYISSSAEQVNLKTITEVVLDGIGGDCYTSDPLSIMMIRRARPLGPNKKVPLWSKDDSGKYSFKATTWESGVCAGTREIKAINASLNMTSTGMAQYFAALMTKIPGTHVGHLVQSPETLRIALDLWGYAGIDVHVEDISAYDNSVGPIHTDGFYSIIKSLFSTSDNEIDLMKIIDTCPIMTGGLGEEKDSYVLLRRSFGISSGDQLTTARGTLINLACKIASVMHVKKMSFNAVMEENINFRLALGLNTSVCTWGFMLKGDDVVVFSKKNKIDSNVFVMGMKLLGFRTDIEPGIIFLMNYINLTKKRKGSDYPYCPPKFLNVNSFASHGLACKRLGNRTVFVEHPLRDIRPARYAVASNIRDMWYHPLKDEACKGLLDIMNIAEDNMGTGIKWTESNLLNYTLSEKGVTDMQSFAEEKGTMDPFSREMLRRTSWKSGSTDGNLGYDTNGMTDDEDDIDGSIDVSDLDPGLAILVKSMANFSIPGFGTSNIGEEIRTRTDVTFSDSNDALVMRSTNYNNTKIKSERQRIIKILKQ